MAPEQDLDRAALDNAPQQEDQTGLPALSEGTLETLSMNGKDHGGGQLQAREVASGSEFPGEDDLQHDAQHNAENVEDATAGSLDWLDLGDRFQKAMAERRAEEDSISRDLENLMKFYSIWAQTPVIYEEARAAKRLRLRIECVQNEETELNNKRTHHQQVLDAFQSALRMLEHSR